MTTSNDILFLVSLTWNFQGTIEVLEILLLYQYSCISCVQKLVSTSPTQSGYYLTVNMVDLGGILFLSERNKTYYERTHYPVTIQHNILQFQSKLHTGQRTHFRPAKTWKVNKQAAMARPRCGRQHG